jgi:hypothetical protein
MAAMPFLLLFVAYVGLLWVAASVAAGKGLVLFVVGMLAFAWSWRKARPALPWLLLVVTAGALTVSLLEGALLLFPGLLSGRLANYVLGGYHSDRDGIYRVDPRLGQRMRPSFRRRLYWNGHSWTHETNADGYRGRRLARADAVFLGDSMVYGHGVEVADTVPAWFGRLGDLAAANLGQPGIGPLQELALFEERGARLEPHRVFVCLHPNDVQDSLDAFPVQELETFLDHPDRRPSVRKELREAPASGIFDWWARHIALPLRGARLVAGLRGKPDWVLDAPARGRAAPDLPYVPSPAELRGPYPPLHAVETAPLGLAWRANRQALAELGRMASPPLVIFDLGYPSEFTQAVEAMARDLGAKYSPAGRVALARAVAGQPVYLPGDGHWTPLGSEIVARELLSVRE